MKYECIKPLLVDGVRIRLGEFVSEEIAALNKKHFADADSIPEPEYDDRPMSISDIAKQKQYKPIRNKRNDLKKDADNPASLA